MMGYDEDSYGAEGEEDDGMTAEQRFAYDKQMFAAQLKQELLYGKKPAAGELRAQAEYDDEYDEEVSLEEGEVPGYGDSEEEPIEQMLLKKSLNGPAPESGTKGKGDRKQGKS